MTDWDERDLTLSFEFLSDGEYTLEIWQDGINANKHAADYLKKTLNINNKTTLPIHLASGGGWVGILTPKISKD